MKKNNIFLVFFMSLIIFMQNICMQTKLVKNKEVYIPDIKYGNYFLNNYHKIMLEEYLSLNYIEEKSIIKEYLRSNYCIFIDYLIKDVLANFISGLKCDVIANYVNIISFCNIKSIERDFELTRFKNTQFKLNEFRILLIKNNFKNCDFFIKNLNLSIKKDLIVFFATNIAFKKVFENSDDYDFSIQLQDEKNLLLIKKYFYDKNPFFVKNNFLKHKEDIIKYNQEIDTYEKLEKLSNKYQEIPFYIEFKNEIDVNKNYTTKQLMDIQYKFKDKFMNLLNEYNFFDFFIKNSLILNDHTIYKKNNYDNILFNKICLIEKNIKIFKEKIFFKFLIYEIIETFFEEDLYIEKKLKEFFLKKENSNIINEFEVAKQMNLL